MYWRGKSSNLSIVPMYCSDQECWDWVTSQSVFELEADHLLKTAVAKRNQLFYIDMYFSEPDCIFKDFILRIEPLFESTILRDNREWIEQLHDWLPSTLQNKDMKLCYRASVNGWASSAFHNLCDDKGPTVVLIESGLYVFGGFAAASWGGNHCLFVNISLV